MGGRERRRRRRRERERESKHSVHIPPLEMSMERLIHQWDAGWSLSILTPDCRTQSTLKKQILQEPLSPKVFAKLQMA